MPRRPQPPAYLKYQTKGGQVYARTKLFGERVNKQAAQRRARRGLCPKCRSIMQRKKDGSGARNRYFGCHRWNCSCCRVWKIDQYTTNAATRIQKEVADDAPIFEFSTTDVQWPSVRKRIKRAAGKYFRYNPNGRRLLHRRCRCGRYLVSQQAGRNPSSGLPGRAHAD
jgi:hypothetical protein